MLGHYTTVFPRCKAKNAVFSGNFLCFYPPHYILGSHRVQVRNVRGPKGELFRRFGAATFVPAQVTDKWSKARSYALICPPPPGTVKGPLNIAGLCNLRQQAGAECVVTRCRVSGNQLLVLYPKEVLRNHGFLSAFFVSFVARQKTPARGRNILSPLKPPINANHRPKSGGDFCFIYTFGSGPPPTHRSGCYRDFPHAPLPSAN